jgi:hypothetical protein
MPSVLSILKAHKHNDVMDNMPDARCDVCGANVDYHESNAVIYGRAYGDRGVWVCRDYPDCDSYVGCHPDDVPMGRLKNQTSRQLSKQCHALFDPLWREAKSPKAQRGNLYKRLSEAMQIDTNDCHFSQMDDEQLKQAIEILKSWRAPK